MYIIFLFIRRHPAVIATVAITILLIAIAFRLTKGIAFAYMNSKLSANAKSTIIILHILISLVLAVSLPNNYLAEFPFIKTLYERNEWWIPLTMFILLLLSIVVIGVIIGAVFRPTNHRRTNPEPKTVETSDIGFMPYRFSIWTLIIVSIGAFIFWLLSGFKGTFDERMSRYYESDKKFDKNYFAGLIFILILFTSLIRMLE